MSTHSDNLSKNKAINNRRPFEKIPIFVVEDHNDVLEFIYRCLGARRIPFYGNKIIHFDSHPDMTIPKYMPAEYCQDKVKLLDNLSIENWLMPTAYAGHIDQMIWMKPEWANQIGDGDYEFRIGDHDSYIRCDSWLEYFLSEGTYQPRCNLNNQRLINLRVFTLTDTLLADQESSANQSQMRQVEFQNCVDSANEQFILDIDLDFFSTANPFRQMLSDGIYNDVKRLFKGRFFDRTFDSHSSEKELMAFTKERSDFIDALEKVFQQLQENVDEKDLDIPRTLSAHTREIFDLIRNVREEYKETPEIAWISTIFNAGCTFDTNDLPHHISTNDEIRRMVHMFKRFLKGLLYSPCIITISRSSDDDYCPTEQVDFIQELVLQTIYDVYGERINSKPILHYKDDDWNV